MHSTQLQTPHKNTPLQKHANEHYSSQKELEQIIRQNHITYKLIRFLNTNFATLLILHGFKIRILPLIFELCCKILYNAH